MEGVWVPSQSFGESRFNVRQHEAYQPVRGFAMGSRSYKIGVDNQWQNSVYTLPALAL